VSVEGLDQFRRALRMMDKALPRTLRVAMNEAAALLIQKAKPLVPRLTGRAADSMKVRSSQSAVRVAVGGSRAPYYPFLDFGGRVGPGKSVHRPFMTEGRYLYPTLRANKTEFNEVLEDALKGAARSAGIDVD
jgi:hypothetical protein